MTVDRTKEFFAAAWHQHRAVGLFLIFFFALATIYNSVTPVFEGPDEQRHYAYIRHVAQGRGLPRQDVPVENLYAYGPYQEASQPPLYYALAALITSWMPPGADDVATATRPNQQWPMSTVRWLRGPYTGALDPTLVLALRICRAVSTLFGGLTLLATYGLGLICLQGERRLALVGAIWACFVPQFVFMGAVANNDAAAAAFSALTFWVMAAWVVRGPSQRLAVVWGAVLGLAILTKISVLALLPISLVGFLLGVQGRHWRPAVAWAGTILGLTLLIGGWWYVRNLIIYGDPLGMSAHVLAPWSRLGETGGPSIWDAIKWTEHTYWSAFGWGTVQFPLWLKRLVIWWMRLGLLGLIPYLWHSWLGMGRRRYVILLLCGGFLVYLGAVIWWTCSMSMGLGRLLFPASAAIGLLLTMGWRGWFGSHWSSVALGLMCVALVILAAISPLQFLVPGFARPPQISQADLEDLRTSPVLVFGDSARLLSVDISSEPTYPDQRYRVDLCWEALKPLEKDYEIFLQLLSVDGRLVSIHHTHPGRGRFPTSAWTPGDAFCEPVWPLVDSWTPAPAVYDLQIGFFDRETGQRLKTRDLQGNPVTNPTVGRVKIWARKAPAGCASGDPDYTLGASSIELLSSTTAPTPLHAGERLALKICWRPAAAIEQDYVMFVHVFDQAGELVAQADDQPCNGAYPTSWWQVGEIVEDIHWVDLPLSLPSGRYEVMGGLYQWPTGQRLSVIDGDGELVPNGVVHLGTVSVADRPAWSGRPKGVLLFGRRKSGRSGE